jgi:hypothetical protein
MTGLFKNDTSLEEDSRVKQLMNDEEMRKYQGSIYEEHAGPGKQGSVARIREATQQQVRTREVADNCPRVRHCDDDKGPPWANMTPPARS